MNLHAHGGKHTRREGSNAAKQEERNVRQQLPRRSGNVRCPKCMGMWGGSHVRSGPLVGMSPHVALCDQATSWCGLVDQWKKFALQSRAPTADKPPPRAIINVSNTAPTDDATATAIATPIVTEFTAVTSTVNVVGQVPPP